MLAMTRPVTSSRLVLIQERRAAADARTAPVKRYRLARWQLERRSNDPASRFDHIKRVYD
jgi:hypothetical protein